MKAEDRFNNSPTRSQQMLGGFWSVTTYFTKETIMTKMTIAAFALLLAALGGCATNGGGDLMGAGAFDAHDGSGPFPPGIVMQADG